MSDPAAGTESPATLTIIRNAPDDVQDRWVRVFIDETPEEILRYGETLTRDLPPGRHRVRAHNTLSADTLEFDAAPGQAVRIKVLQQRRQGRRADADGHRLRVHHRAARARNAGDGDAD